MAKRKIRDVTPLPVAQPKPKPKMGAPTKYDPKFCQMVIDHMSDGLSLESFAGVIDVHKGTLYDWRLAHQDFSDAVKRGVDKCRFFWEKLGIDGIHNESWEGGSKSLNSTVWKFNMQNRFSWADKSENKNTTTHKGEVTYKTDWGGTQEPTDSNSVPGDEDPADS